MSELFERVVCGVDHTEAGAVAARQAARLTRPDGSLTLVSVDDSSIAVHAGFQMAAVAEELLHEAQEALEHGRAVAAATHTVETVLLEGDPLHCLLGEIERRDASLAAVGTHERSRAAGIALGSVATHLLHEAPCSVLLARAQRDDAGWPRSLVVGVDGSPESAVAVAAARELGERFGTEIRFVAATGEIGLDVDAARALVPEVESLPGRAVDELHVLSEHADLVVVGSRGLKGLRSLGSVSERVAHEARCSVLVARASGEWLHRS